MAWQPQWATLEPGHFTMQPGFFTGNPQLMGPLWWGGLRNRLEPLVANCLQLFPSQQVQPITFQQWCSGQLPAHSTCPTTLHTQCCVVGKCKTWLAGQGTFFLMPHGSRRGPTNPNRAYVKVHAFALDGENEHEFYLHTLLCYMYHGPPPSPHRVAGHLCSHKLCCLPWHLAWITQSANVAMGHAQRKRQWAQDP